MIVNVTNSLGDYALHSQKTDSLSSKKITGTFGSIFLASIAGQWAVNKDLPILKNV
jgi:hypothetical protein